MHVPFDRDGATCMPLRVNPSTVSTFISSVWAMVAHPHPNGAICLLAEPADNWGRRSPLLSNLEFVLSGKSGVWYISAKYVD